MVRTTMYAFASMNFTLDEWDHPSATGGSPWTGNFYIDRAKALEHACCDCLILDDMLTASEAYRSTSEAYLKHALMVPKHDPAPLAVCLVPRLHDLVSRLRLI